MMLPNFFYLGLLKGEESSMLLQVPLTSLVAQTLSRLDTLA